jgi:hypothetical protein
MPRRNQKPVSVMRCGSCNRQIPSRYGKTHIDRCTRASRKRKSLRHTKYHKE